MVVLKETTPDTDGLPVVCKSRVTRREARMLTMEVARFNRADGDRVTVDRGAKGYTVNVWTSGGSFGETLIYSADVRF